MPTPLARTTVLALLATCTAELAAQGQWEQRFPTIVPPARSNTALAYDAARGVTVMFGGDTGPAPLADTWEWNGVTWTQRASVHVPPGRHSHAMTYDAARGRVVMFGGERFSVDLGDTWEWDGVDWIARPVAGPFQRRAHDLVFDSTRNVVLLCGGVTGASAYIGETWRWNGTAWSQVFPANPPPMAVSHGAAYDALRDRTILALYEGVGARQTWEWNGSDWTRRTPPQPPSTTPQMAFDAARGVIVGYGEGGGTLDTWEWDGATWHLVVDAPRPQYTGTSTLAYDAARGRMVSFGGALGATRQNETWEYVPFTVATFARFGAGCLGSAGIPSLDVVPGSRALLGQSIVFELTALPVSAPAFGILARSRTDFLGLPLPAPLDLIGMPGCALLVSPDFTVQMPTLAGRGAWIVAIPNDAGLGGQEFFVQGLVGDPLANALGITLSNGGEATIGVR